MRILAWQKGLRTVGRREPGGGTPGRPRKGLHGGKVPRVPPRVLGALAVAAAAIAVGAVLLTGQPRVPLTPEFSSVTVGFVWPEYPGELRVTDEAVLLRLARALAGAPARATTAGEGGPVQRELYWRLEMEGAGGTSELLATREFRVYDPAQATLLDSPDLEAILSDLTGQLHRSFFGEPIAWDQALRLLPVGGTASIRDVETGLAFQVRRHRGDAHADVEPLTVQDTETLQTIYGGDWSWKRRAVVATVADRAIAASINGMPHGWGDLFDNEFVGHFCLHFTGSRVHTTWRVDDGHQLMVLKAAGALADVLDGAEPEELSRWILAAVNHREQATLRHLADALDPELQDALFSQIRTLFVWGTRQVTSDEETARIRVETTLYFNGPDPNTPYRRSPVLEFHRAKAGDPWILAFGSLAQLLRESPAVAEEGSLAYSDDALPTLSELMEDWC